MSKSIFLMIGMLLIVSCNKEEKRHTIPIISALEKLEQDFCFDEEMQIVGYGIYANWNEFLDDMCGCRLEKPIVDPKGCERCVYNWTNFFSKGQVPEEMLKNKEFILVEIYPKIRRPCPPRHACPNDTGITFVFDATTLELIDTPRIKQLKASCLEKKNKK